MVLDKHEAYEKKGKQFLKFLEGKNVGRKHIEHW